MWELDWPRASNCLIPVSVWEACRSSNRGGATGVGKGVEEGSLLQSQDRIQLWRRSPWFQFLRLRLQKLRGKSLLVTCPPPAVSQGPGVLACALT